MMLVVVGVMVLLQLLLVMVVIRWHPIPTIMVVMTPATSIRSVDVAVMTSRES